MPDRKQVRRRRAVLGLLVVASLILLTAYFGAPEDSPLHSIQRGIVEVLSPVQSGASKVLSPVRDVAGWFSSTFHAKSEVAQLTRENHHLTQEFDQAQYAELQNRQYSRLLKLDTGPTSLDQYSPVTASVIGRDPLLWYDTIEVNAGSGNGIKQGDPVVGPGGLVGNVTDVGPGYAIVTEITDAKSAVGAEVEDAAGDQGELAPDVGSPNALLLQDLPAHAPITNGQEVVTSGFKDSANPALQSLYPPGIPIGQVLNANQNTLLTQQEVTVQPNVDLRHLTTVQILTRPHPNTERAQVSLP